MQENRNMQENRPEDIEIDRKICRKIRGPAVHKLLSVYPSVRVSICPYNHLSVSSSHQLLFFPFQKMPGPPGWRASHFRFRWRFTSDADREPPSSGRTCGRLIDLTPWRTSTTESSSPTGYCSPTKCSRLLLSSSFPRAMDVDTFVCVLLRASRLDRRGREGVLRCDVLYLNAMDGLRLFAIG